MELPGIKFLAVTLVLTIIQTSRSQVEVQNHRKPSEWWSLNEIENIDRSGKHTTKELPSNWQDGNVDAVTEIETQVSELWEITPELPRYSNNIKMDSQHLLQDRSGAFPTNIKIYKIYNKRGFLAVNKKGEVYSTKLNGNPEIKFKTLQYSLKNRKFIVRLQSEQHNKYIAISCKTGNVYTTTDQQNLETVLIYSPDVSNGDTFQSQKCSKQDSNVWYLGIKKDGRIKNGKMTSASDTGARFLLINSPQSR